MIESIYIAIISWTFVHILIDTDMIFNKWWLVLNKLPEWLAKPLGKCEYCMSGQIALWYYLITEFQNYNLFIHVTFVSLAIFVTKLINTLNTRYNESD